MASSCYSGHTHYNSPLDHFPEATVTCCPGGRGTVRLSAHLLLRDPPVISSSRRRSHTRKPARSQAQPHFTRLEPGRKPSLRSPIQSVQLGTEATGTRLGPRVRLPDICSHRAPQAPRRQEVPYQKRGSAPWRSMGDAAPLHGTDRSRPWDRGPQEAGGAHACSPPSPRRRRGRVPPAAAGGSGRCARRRRLQRASRAPPAQSLRKHRSSPCTEGDAEATRLTKRPETQKR